MTRLRGKAKAALDTFQEQLAGEERALEAYRQEALEAEARFNAQQTIVTALRTAYNKFEKSLSAPRQPAKPTKPAAASKRKKGGLPQGDVTVPLTGVESKAEVGEVKATRNYNTDTWNDPNPATHDAVVGEVQR